MALLVFYFEHKTVWSFCLHLEVLEVDGLGSEDVCIDTRALGALGVRSSRRKPTPSAVHLRCVCSALELEHTKQGGEDRPSNGRTVATRCGRTLNAEQ